MQLWIVLLVFCLSQSVSLASECIAHRGNNRRYLENSVEALQSALDIGSDGVEFDIHHTKDGKPIVMHEKTLARVSAHKPGKDCPLSKKVKDLPLKVIRDNCQLRNGEAVPTLEEILARFRDHRWYFFIELKDIPSLRTLDLIENYLGHMPEKVRVSTFNKKVLRTLIKAQNFNPFWKKVKLFRAYNYPTFPFVLDKHGANMYWPFSWTLFWTHLRKRETAIWTLSSVESENKIDRAHQRKIGFIITNNPMVCLALKAGRETRKGKSLAKPFGADLE